MEPQLETWYRFFNASLTKRLPPETFQSLVKACLLKTEVASGRSLASALLAESRKMGLQQADPRVPLYINELLNLELCSAADVLLSLLPAPPLVPPQPLSLPSPSPSSIALGGGEGGHGGERIEMLLPEMERMMRPSVEAMVLEGLAVKVGEGLLKTKGDVVELLRACVVWMERVPGSMSLGYLISATLGSALAGEVLGLPSMKGDFFFLACYYISLFTCFYFFFFFFQLQKLIFQSFSFPFLVSTRVFYFFYFEKIHMVRRRW